MPHFTITSLEYCTSIDACTTLDLCVKTIFLYNNQFKLSIWVTFQYQLPRPKPEPDPYPTAASSFYALTWPYYEEAQPELPSSPKWKWKMRDDSCNKLLSIYLIFLSLYLCFLLQNDSHEIQYKPASGDQLDSCQSRAVWWLEASPDHGWWAFNKWGPSDYPNPWFVHYPQKKKKKNLDLSWA